MVDSSGSGIVLVRLCITIKGYIEEKCCAEAGNGLVADFVQEVHRLEETSPVPYGGRKPMVRARISTGQCVIAGGEDGRLRPDVTGAWYGG